jgi:4-hydroxybenzoate polyprenyltransferase
MEPIQSRARQGRVADAPSAHWVYRALPRPLWPFAQIARWDRPIGWRLLLWPCLWSAAMAAATPISNGESAAHLTMLGWHAALFLIGAIAMRGAGCAWNDILDAGIDAKVERTASRPLPSGQISKAAALAFLVAQAMTGFLVLIQFNAFTIWLGIASLGIVAVYPLMKRVTDWPQLVLGLAFSWGALVGWAAHFGSLSAAPILLYAGTVLWVIGYDTIYAHQDREDDALVGVRSTARLFGDRTKPALGVLYGGMLALLAAAFFTSGVAPTAYVGLGLAGWHLARQIRALDINDPAQCLALFKSNDAVGWMIFAMLLTTAVIRHF